MLLFYLVLDCPARLFALLGKFSSGAQKKERFRGIAALNSGEPSENQWAATLL